MFDNICVESLSSHYFAYELLGNFIYVFELDILELYLASDIWLWSLNEYHAYLEAIIELIDVHMWVMVSPEVYIPVYVQVE